MRNCGCSNVFSSSTAVGLVEGVKKGKSLGDSQSKSQMTQEYGSEERDDGVFVVVWKEGKGEWALSRGRSFYWFSQQIRQSGCGHSSRRPSTSKMGSEPIKASLPSL
jgi:hypothetical protein